MLCGVARDLGVFSTSGAMLLQVLLAGKYRIVRAILALRMRTQQRQGRIQSSLVVYVCSLGRKSPWVLGVLLFLIC